MSLRIRMASAIVIVASFLTPAIAVAGGGGGTDIKRDTPAVVRDVSADLFWFTRSSNDGSCATGTVGIFAWGVRGDVPLPFDEDGDGQDQPAIYRDQGTYSSFFARDEDNPTQATQIDFGGEPTDIPIAGNLDPSDPGDEVGVYRGSNNTFYLRTDSGTVEIPMGAPGDLPLVGNFDGSVDGSEEVGLFRPSTNEFFFAADNTPGAGASLTQGVLGAPGDAGAVGDWDGDGTATRGVNRSGGATFFHFQTNGTTGVTIDNTIVWGDPGSGDVAVYGDWDGRAVDEDGC